ncbi:class I SAM-dependent methyltransferase [bacterium]|nr:class I SAM-dependent methyltransferase [bacterium]
MNTDKRTSEIFNFTAKTYKQHEYKEIFHVDTYSFLKDERLDFSNKVVLDVGCGLGECSAWFLKKGAKTVVSLDPSHNSLLETRRYINKQNKKKNSLIIQARVPSLPFSDNKFDIVFAHGMMSYVEDIPEALKSIFRVVKKDGEIIVSFVKKNRFDPFLEIVRAVCSKIPVGISKILSIIMAALFYPIAPILIHKKPSFSKGYTLDRTFFELCFVKRYKTVDKKTTIKMIEDMGMKVTEMKHPDRLTNFVLLAKKISS